jgi:hypothetical protein
MKRTAQIVSEEFRELSNIFRISGNRHIDPWIHPGKVTEFDNVFPGTAVGFTERWNIDTESDRSLQTDPPEQYIKSSRGLENSTLFE